MSEQAAAASLAAALAAVQGQLPPIVKDDKAQVGTHKYDYANLATIHAKVLPLMSAHGLAWMCRPTLVDGRFVLAYTLTHAPTGEHEDGDYPLTEGPPQAMGGQITYARRYALCAVLGIAPADDDDDAQAAQSEWRPPANPQSRKADRHRADRSGPLPDDQWTTGEPRAPEDQPGSSTPAQHTALGIAFTRAGISDRNDRLAAVASILNLAEVPSTSKALSFSQADRLIKRLAEMAAGK